ncbi:MAG: hypothetical protein IT405_02660 [Candidatus Yanofskybacteria bacterium]|nr:hypothetical protein [Candidatus Yanofskybacteria bacterium]
MAKGKELSERELAALSALNGALAVAAVSPVSVTHVRRFTKVRETNKDGVRRCTMRLTFGFRRLDVDECGTGTAVITLWLVVAVDSAKLCSSYYFVWAPVDAHITVTQGKNMFRLPFARPVSAGRVGVGERSYFVAVQGVLSVRKK